MNRNNILFLCFFLGWNILSAQSHFLDKTAKEMPTFQKQYFYPSIIRALAGEGDSPIKDMVHELRFIRVLRIDSSFISEKDFKVNEVANKLVEEGFELMGEMSEKGSVKELYALEKKNEIKGFIACVKEEDSLMFIEIVGNIHLNKLSDLLRMDLSMFDMFIE